MSTLTRFVGKSKLSLVRNAPTLAIGAGVVGLVGAIYLSGRAAIQSQSIIEDYKKEMKDEDEAYLELKKIEMDEPERYAKLVEKHGEVNEQSHVVSKIGITMRFAGKVLRVYGPTIALAGLSIASIVYGRNAFQKRLASVAAALQVTNATFERYRKSVAEAHGEEAEADLYKSSVKKHLERMGNQIDSIEDAQDARNNVSRTVFARWFDQTNANWTNKPGENRMFIASSQNYFNDILQRRGYVFLNEVYTHLGFQPVPEGQTMGWIVNDDYPDTVIDFDIFNSKSEESRAFVNDQTQNVLLDFHGVTYILGEI